MNSNGSYPAKSSPAVLRTLVKLLSFTQFSFFGLHFKRSEYKYCICQVFSSFFFVRACRDKATWNRAPLTVINKLQSSEAILS